MSDLSPAELGKLASARAAVAIVEDGMRLGLGTGSTAAVMVRELAARVQAEGLRLRCAATSRATADQARGLGLSIETLDQIGWLDLTIDGADEIDPDLNLIKGGGGAHLREKIVASASDRMVAIADPAKLVDQLGAFDLPVEIIPFGREATQRHVADALRELGYDAPAITLRQRDDAPFVTDEGNLILDLGLGAITDAPALAATLSDLAGVVEHGLFLGICDQAIIGQQDGAASILDSGAA